MPQLHVTHNHSLPCNVVASPRIFAQRVQYPALKAGHATACTLDIQRTLRSRDTTKDALGLAVVPWPSEPRVGTQHRGISRCGCLAQPPYLSRASSRICPVQAHLAQFLFDRNHLQTFFRRSSLLLPDVAQSLLLQHDPLASSSIPGRSASAAFRISSALRHSSACAAPACFCSSPLLGPALLALPSPVPHPVVLYGEVSRFIPGRFVASLRNS